MGTVKDKLAKLLATKDAIKAAIIGKGQTIADTDPFSTYPDKIAAIETGIDTSDATATASVMLAGETAYARGEKITGNIPSKSASDLTASGATVTAPAGYYPSAVSKSVATVTQATPTISNSSGKITASVTQSEGYVASGTKSATLQLTTKAAATYTPGTANQTIASGQYLTGTQTIKGDANLIAENIKYGKSIFGVDGTMDPGYGYLSLSKYYVSISGQTATITAPDDFSEIKRLVLWFEMTDEGGQNDLLVFETESVFVWNSSGTYHSTTYSAEISVSGTTITLTDYALKFFSNTDLEEGILIYTKA